MEIEFDFAKSAANIVRRGLSFDRVAAFDFDTARIVVDDRRDYGEVRFRATGLMKEDLVVLVSRCGIRPFGSFLCASPIKRSVRIMLKRKPNPMLIDEENPAFTKADFKKSKRVEDFPELAHLSKRKPGQRGPQKAPKKTPVTIRLDADVAEHYRDTGAGWQARLNRDLRRVAKLG